MSENLPVFPVYESTQVYCASGFSRSKSVESAHYVREKSDFTVGVIGEDKIFFKVVSAYDLY